MKTYVGILAVTVILSAPAMAHQSGQGQKQGEGGMMGMMGGMSPGNMQDMHEHMEQMEELMRDIHRENNPQKHYELMEKHMESMQEGIHMMYGRPDEGKGKRKDKGKEDSSPMYEERMEMLEQRMNMMQQLMEQMMEHQREQSRSGRKSN